MKPIDSTNRRHAGVKSIGARSAALGALLGAVLCAPLAHAGVITVGRSGSLNNCTEPTIQAAIDRAKKLGGYNIIWVTRDVQDQFWSEHLTIEDQDLDLIGGFEDCNALAPSGQVEIAWRPGDQRPILSIRGAGVVNLRNLVISNGRSGGIDYVGRGSLTLENVRVEHNGVEGGTAPGIYFAGSGGDAYLQFLDDVSVVDNRGTGVQMWGTSKLTMGNRRNAISRNAQHGLLVSRPAVADVGAKGNVFSENQGFGVYVSNLDRPDGGQLQSRFYSSDRNEPLGITQNGRGAFGMRDSGTPPLYRVCMNDVRITHHAMLPSDEPESGSLVSVIGASSLLDFNGNCALPDDAVASCDERFCNFIAFNTTFADKPLISLENGARVLVNRMAIESNTAGAVASAGRDNGGPNRIQITNSLVSANELARAVLEVRDGGLLEAVNVTAADNFGAFLYSLVSDGALSFSVSDSILDDAASLLALGGDSNTVNVTRVMARNSFGAGPQDVVIVAEPAFMPGGYRLAPDALGIDFSPKGTGLDLAGNPRNVDTAGMENVGGPRDIGAYESQVPFLSPDLIFRSGFERVSPGSSD